MKPVTDSSLDNFVVLEEAGAVTTKAGTFYSATVSDPSTGTKQPVTLVVKGTTDSAVAAHVTTEPSEAHNQFSLCSTTRFNDVRGTRYCKESNQPGTDLNFTLFDFSILV